MIAAVLQMAAGLAIGAVLAYIISGDWKNDPFQ